MRRPLWVMGGVGVVAILIAMCAETVQRRTPPDTRVVDSLKDVNQKLAVRNDIFKAEIAVLRMDRDYALRERDSLQVLSAAATKKIQQARTTLPPAEAAPDSTLRANYRDALQQLDAAIAEMARKDAIARKDASAHALANATIVKYEGQIANLTEMYQNSVTTATFWEGEYRELWAEKNPRCGKKCGIAIGVVTTVAAALVVKKVQDVLAPRRP